MEKHTIGGLKNILVAATNFDDIQDYFFTISETNRAALDGKSSKNKALKDIVTTTVAKICLCNDLVKIDEKIILVNMTMVEVRQRYFWHGSGMINGKYMFTYFYFAELDKGMISIAKGDHVFYGRVSCQKVLNKNPMEGFSDN